MVVTKKLKEVRIPGTIWFHNRESSFRMYIGIDSQGDQVWLNKWIDDSIHVDVYSSKSQYNDDIDYYQEIATGWCKDGENWTKLVPEH